MLLARSEAIAALREMWPKQEQLLRERDALTPREIWDSLGISKQGAMDILRPLLDVGLVKRIGALKNGRYVLK